MRKLINFQYDRLYLKELLILAPRYHSNLLSFLTPILGFYGVNVREFITQLDNVWKFIDYDVIIPISVVLSKIKTYEISLKTPTIMNILSNTTMVSENQIEVDILSIYKLALLKTIKNNYFYSKFLRINYKMIRSYLKSVNKQLYLVEKVAFYQQSNLFNKFNYFLEGLYKNKVILDFYIGIKKRLLFYKYFSVISENRFGFFYMYSGISNKSFSKIRMLSWKYNMDFLKIKSSVINSLSKFKWSRGIILYGFSKSFASLYSFWRNINFYSTSKMLLLYVRFNNNLFSLKFFKTFLDEFKKAKAKKLYVFNSIFKIYNKNLFVLRLNILLKFLKIISLKCQPIINY